MIIARKIFFTIFFLGGGGGGTCPPCPLPPSPTLMNAQRLAYTELRHPYGMIRFKPERSHCGDLT